MGAGGRNAISKRAFASSLLLLPSFGSFAFNYYDNDRTRSTRQLEPTPKLALSLPLLSFPPLNQTTFIKAESERATMCVSDDCVPHMPRALAKYTIME